MRMRGVVLFAALSLVACKKEDASSSAKPTPTTTATPTTTDTSIDLLKAGGAIEQRMANLWNRPVVNQATDKFFDALGDNASLKAKGVAVVAMLQADPGVSAPIEKLMGQLTSDPTVMKTVMELMSTHPGASPDDIGKMVGDRFAAQWASPQITAAWGHAWDGLLTRVAADPDLAVIEHSVTQRFETKFKDVTVLVKWNKRIQELGATPDKATDVFLDKFFAENRIETIVAEVLNNPTFRTESANALGQLIALPTVSKDMRVSAAEMLADPVVHDAAVSLLKQLITTHPDAQVVAKQLDALLTSPSVVKTLKRILHTAATDPAVGAVGDAWIAALSKDPGLQASFDKFIFGW